MIDNLLRCCAHLLHVFRLPHHLDGNLVDFISAFDQRLSEFKAKHIVKHSGTLDAEEVEADELYRDFQLAMTEKIGLSISALGSLIMIKSNSSRRSKLARKSFPWRCRMPEQARTDARYGFPHDCFQSAILTLMSIPLATPEAPLSCSLYTHPSPCLPRRSCPAPSAL